jgi:dTMP kinase
VKDKFSGKFIVLDGPDGCGKTTQLNLLANYLKDKSIEVVQTEDPGGTKIGEQISRLLKYDAQGEMDVHTEAMLFMASRAQLAAEVIKPALEKGKTVLCDRYISATCAYQGSSGYPVDKIIELGKFAVGDIWPDLTIILDIPAEEGRDRTGHKKYQRAKTNHEDANQAFLFKNVITDRFDSRKLEYHKKARKSFLKIGEYYPGVVKVIDASGDIQTVHKKIIEIVEKI